MIEGSPGFSVLPWAPSLWPGSGPSLFQFCTGAGRGDLCGAVWLQGIPHGPWSEVAEENHKDDSNPCVSAASPAGGWAVISIADTEIDCKWILPFGCPAWPWWSHRPVPCCRVNVPALRAGWEFEWEGLSYGNSPQWTNLPALISWVVFSLIFQLLSWQRLELNFGLTEHPQLEPVQWEDEVLAVSGRKVLTLHWEFQEWEIFFVVYLCSYGYICLRFKQDWGVSAIPQHTKQPQLLRAPSQNTSVMFPDCWLSQTKGCPAPGGLARTDASLVQIS